MSPPARATEMAAAAVLESTFLLEGSLDPVTTELAMLEAVMLAEAKDHSNWLLLEHLASRMAPGDLRRQFETVAVGTLAQEEEHLTWARATREALVISMAIGPDAEQDCEPS